MAVEANEIARAISDAFEGVAEVAIERAAQAVADLLVDNDDVTDKVINIVYALSDVDTWLDQAEGAIDNIRVSVKDVERQLDELT